MAATPIKLVLSPALIGVASLVGRRWGPRAAGWFTALPLTSGPVMFVLAVEQGPAFASRACVGASLAVVSLSAYALTYAKATARYGWMMSCLLGCAAFMASTWLLHSAELSLTWAFVSACVALTFAIRVLPREVNERVHTPAVAWDIPLRMVLAGLMVWVLSRAAIAIGPDMSGLLAPFPIAATILVAFTQRREGAVAARQFLRSLLVGLFSFAVFLLVVGAGLKRADIGTVFTVAVVVTLMMHGVVVWTTRFTHAPLPQCGE
ncbi:MAG: hypothetical protein ABJE47_17355 [bacterium]